MVNQRTLRMQIRKEAAQRRAQERASLNMKRILNERRNKR